MDDRETLARRHPRSLCERLCRARRSMLSDGRSSDGRGAHGYGERLSVTLDQAHRSRLGSPQDALPRPLG